MAKHGKKADPKAGTQEIVKLKDFQEAEARVEYEDEDDEENQAEGEQRLKKMKVPKAAYRVMLILLALVLGLAVWLNRENLNPESIGNWFKVQLMGSGQGDGFPVPVTGSNVSTSNFLAYNGDALVLSDMALTILSPSGKELLSLRHSLNQPAMYSSYGKTLLYNANSTGYLLLSGTDTVLTGTADREILAGTTAQNGKYALGLYGEHGASELNVYLKTGDLQYHYPFAKDYITSIALNYDGTHGAVCTVRSDKGEIVSKVTVFDFNSEEPITSFETRDNLLVGVSWTEGGDLYAVGDSKLLLASSSDYAFSEYSYDGRQLTAFRLDGGRAFVSISAYEHAGPSTLLVFRGQDEPLKVEADERIVSLSVSGGTVGALIDTEAVFYDYSTGTELGRAPAGADAKSIALGSERMAYVLGVSEVRTVEIE